MRAKNERDNREDNERQGARSNAFGSHEPADAHDANDDHDKVKQIASGKRERLARDTRGKLQVRDDRTRKGDRADEHCNTHFTHVEGPVVRAIARGHEEGIDAYEYRSGTDERMEQCHQFGHGRHLNTTCFPNADGRTDEHGHDDEPNGIGGELEAFDGGCNDDDSERYHHADDAKHVATHRALLLGKPCKRKDEEECCNDIGKRLPA